MCFQYKMGIHHIEVEWHTNNFNQCYRKASGSLLKLKCLSLSIGINKEISHLLDAILTTKQWVFLATLKAAMINTGNSMPVAHVTNEIWLQVPPIKSTSKPIRNKSMNYKKSISKFTKESKPKVHAYQLATFGEPFTE